MGVTADIRLVSLIQTASTKLVVSIRYLERCFLSRLSSSMSSTGYYIRYHYLPGQVETRVMSISIRYLSIPLSSDVFEENMSSVPASTSKLKMLHRIANISTLCIAAQ